MTKTICDPPKDTINVMHDGEMIHLKKGDEVPDGLKQRALDEGWGKRAKSKAKETDK